MHIAQIARTIKHVLEICACKVKLAENPHYPMNGAVYLVVRASGKDHLITVQPILSTVEVEKPLMFGDLIRKWEGPDEGKTVSRK